MDGYVSTPGGSATFLCTPRPGMSEIDWLVNGTQIGDLDISNITAEFDENIGIGTLTFGDVLLEYNETTVTCLIDFTRLSSNLLVQGRLTIIQTHSHLHRNHQCHILHYIGLLSDVVSLELTLLSDSIVSLRWKPPFSLDITVVDPDIEGYCVDVISTTCTSSLTLHSQCGINRTEFNYSLPVGTVCEEHTYSVTTVNVVGNGTRATISIINALHCKRILSPWSVAIIASIQSLADPALVSLSDISANATRLIMVRLNVQRMLIVIMTLLLLIIVCSSVQCQTDPFGS